MYSDEDCIYKKVEQKKLLTDDERIEAEETFINDMECLHLELDWFQEAFTNYGNSEIFLEKRKLRVANDEYLSLLRELNVKLNEIYGITEEVKSILGLM
ncbi:hypothetical protein AB834_00410 [PVC group bacterium (ex Bugula neritina AB1)]|nr:hypothetical protein AB834_00410 [PVC group bacterium (ex Bugula neritina AB1)]